MAWEQYGNVQLPKESSYNNLFEGFTALLDEISEFPIAKEPISIIRKITSGKKYAEIGRIKGYTRQNAQSLASRWEDNLSDLLSGKRLQTNFYGMGRPNVVMVCDLKLMDQVAAFGKELRRYEVVIKREDFVDIFRVFNIPEEHLFSTDMKVLCKVAYNLNYVKFEGKDLLCWDKLIHHNFSRIKARVYNVLRFSVDPLTIEQISEKTKISILYVKAALRLNDMCDCIQEGDRTLYTASYADKGTVSLAVDILRSNGKPMRGTDLMEKINKIANKKISSIAVLRDVVVPLGKSGDWALKEWDPEFTTLKDLMIGVLKEADRPLSRMEIHKGVLETRPETPYNSISGTVSGYPQIFLRTKDKKIILGEWKQKFKGELFKKRMFKSSYIDWNQRFYEETRDRPIAFSVLKKTYPLGFLYQLKYKIWVKSHIENGERYYGAKTEPYNERALTTNQARIDVLDLLQTSMPLLRIVTEVSQKHNLSKVAVYKIAQKITQELNQEIKL